MYPCTYAYICIYIRVEQREERVITEEGNALIFKSRDLAKGLFSQSKRKKEIEVRTKNKNKNQSFAIFLSEIEWGD